MVISHILHLALCSFPVFRSVMLDIMAGMDLKDSLCETFRGDSTGASLERVVVHPLCAATYALVQLRITVEVPQLQFLDKVVDFPVVAQRLFPLFDSSADH